jgi:hypothetical protein
VKKIILVCLLLAARLAGAAIEDKPAQPPGQAVQRTTATTSAGVPYTDISRTERSKTLVHEYVDAAGTVFAVSWSGPFKPDLNQLLGRHFAAYKKEAGSQGGRRNRVQEVDLGDLVVVSSGHMGAFEGRAWLPSRLPAGFDPQEMK